MSVGVRGTILGYEAAASYSVLHGESCFQGIWISTMLIWLQSLHWLILSCLMNYTHFFRIFWHIDLLNCVSVMLMIMRCFCGYAVIPCYSDSIKNSDGSYSGSGFLCEISEQESSGFVAELIANAKRLIGIDNFICIFPKDCSRLILADC